MKETDIIDERQITPANTSENETRAAEAFERQPEPSVKRAEDDQQRRLAQHLATMVAIAIGG